MGSAASDNQDHFTTQDWASYTPEQHDVWSVLYDRRMAELRETGSRVFLEGSDTIGLRRDRVPDLNEVNQSLGDLTGWNAVPVTGFIPAKDFFACLAERRFPTTVIVRSREQLEYLEEPDIFHDVFGHVPMHADPVFADFLQQFGQIAAVPLEGLILVFRILIDHTLRATNRGQRIEDPLHRDAVAAEHTRGRHAVICRSNPDQ